LRRGKAPLDLTPGIHKRLRKPFDAFYNAEMMEMEWKEGFDPDLKKTANRNLEFMRSKTPTKKEFRFASNLDFINQVIPDYEPISKEFAEANLIKIAEQ
jgi:hypothetical protein